MRDQKFASKGSGRSVSYRQRVELSGCAGRMQHRSCVDTQMVRTTSPGNPQTKVATQLGWAEVRLGLVGWFTVRRGGRVFTSAEVGSRKARTVLALLAVERYQIVSPWTIADVLWQGPRPRRPVENVAILVSRLRATLGPSVVVGGRTGYRLNDATRIDIQDAAELVATAEAHLAAREPRRARAAVEPALELLGAGPVLADHQGAAWTQPAQIEHTDLLRRARHATAQAALAAGDAWAAVAAAEAAVRADPLDEVAYRALLNAHNSAGEPARALTAYERLRRTLARELGVDPAPATRQLYLSILRGNAHVSRLGAVPHGRRGTHVG